MRNGVKKVPVVLQMESLECGTACLAMVLAYYKKYITLEQLRTDSSVSRDKSNAKDILIAARHYGLQAKGFRYEVDALRKSEDFPMIIHWNFNHFVVLNGFRGKKAVINDPADGCVEVELEEFERSFTGIALVLKPGEGFQPEGAPKSLWKLMKKRLKGVYLAFAFVIVLQLITSVLGVLEPLFYKVFVDEILIGNAPEWISPLLMGMTVVCVVYFLLEVVRNLYLNKIKAKMCISAATKFMWHTLHLPIEFFLQRFTGDISARQQSNDDIVESLCNKIVPVILNVTLIGFYFVLLVYYDVWMASIGLGMVICNIIIMRSIVKRNINMAKSMQRDYGKLAGVMISGISMIETIKASGAEFGYFENLSGYQAKYNNALVRLTKRNLYGQLVPQILSGIGNAVILILGIYNILKGQFTIGSLMAFQGIFSYFLTPVNELIDSMQEIQDVASGMDRVEDVMNYEEEELKGNLNRGKENDVWKQLTGEIELSHVTFSYGRLGEPFIKDFNLKIKKGNIMALVGGSGSGKSTMAKLISGLYPVNQGEILFDGKKKEEINRYIFTSSVAMVDQNISIFSDTIQNNITMWDETIDEETLIQACKDACIHDDIILRKNGYQSPIQEGGANFSGGQLQRIEIARAFVAQTTILIMDEATSALDPITEKKIMESVKKRGITCLIIAHRLSTIRDADKIIVMEQGVQVEQGEHETLLKQNGKYAKLVKSE